MGTEAKPKECPGNCTKCNSFQQVYCCTQMVYDLRPVMQSLSERLTEIEKRLSMQPVRPEELVTPKKQ